MCEFEEVRCSICGKKMRKKFRKIRKSVADFTNHIAAI